MRKLMLSKETFEICPNCKGLGKYRYDKDFCTCERCRGTGKIITYAPQLKIELPGELTEIEEDELDSYINDVEEFIIKRKKRLANLINIINIKNT